MEPAKISLEGNLDTKTAPLLRSRLAALSEAGEQVVVDASQVSRISTACVQLLLTFVNGHEGRIRFECCSKEFSAAFLAMGLRDWLRSMETT